MNVESLPEQRIGSLAAERGREKAPEAFKPEQIPQAQEWLDMARGQLTRPEAAEWKEGSFVGRRPFMKDYFKVSTSQKYLVLDNPELKRSFVITDGPAIEGEYRYTTIFFTELPDNENETLKRHGAIDFISDKNGNLVSISGGDSKNGEGQPVHGAGAWYAGWTIAGTPSLEDKNELTVKQVTDLMGELVPQVSQAQASHEKSTYMRDFRSREDEMVDVIFAIEEAKQRGSAKEVERGLKKLNRVRDKLVSDFNIDMSGLEEAAKEATERDKQKGHSKKEQEKKDTGEIKEESTPEARGIIPRYMLEDPDFKALYEELEAELTENGKKHMPEDFIDRQFMQLYQVRREASRKKEQEALQQKEPVEV